MTVWIEKLGYPLVMVEHTKKENTLRVKQTGRFTYLKDNSTTETQYWPIPFSYRIENGSEQRIWLLDGDESSI